MKSLPRSSRQKTAYEKYRTSGYTDQADAGTGTYAGGTGFYSNQNEHAVLMYKYGEQNYTEYYKKPVIKSTSGQFKKFRKLLQDWKITRSIAEGITEPVLYLCVDETRREKQRQKN